jgi:hypothetical protein
MPKYNPLTKGTVIQLVNDLIAKAEFNEKVVQCKELHGLSPELALGSAWYRGLMNRHDALLSTKKSNVKDTKQNTWVQCEHFLQKKLTHLYNLHLEGHPTIT